MMPSVAGETKANLAKLRVRITNLRENIKLLIVDDNPLNSKLMGALIDLTECDASFASDGQEALTVLAQTQFDAAIIDIQMPVMNGPEAVRRIRASEASKKLDPLPIIACTALSNTDRSHDFMSEGFDYYLRKPVTIVDFVDCLEWIEERLAN